MPHTQRKQSESGFYHIVTKGDGGQVIFESDDDRDYYLHLLEQAIDQHRVKIHAYCLMDNHVHLLSEDRNGELSAFMKQLNEGYAAHFKAQTKRVGHVFQGRFWSEPVETDEYFLAALRYIHANPEPAGICAAKNYSWSSYKAYTGASSFVEIDLARSLLGDIEDFKRFSASGGSFARPFPKSRLRRHLSSDELVSIAIALLGRETLNGLRALPPKERIPHLHALLRSGFTEGEIARTTGLSQSSIHRLMH